MNTSNSITAFPLSGSIGKGERLSEKVMSAFDVGKVTQD
jgi:hypothetical protein